MESVVSNGKPHAVCVPFPAQGHINPMLKLAKLLHHRGFFVTFVNSEFNHNRLIKSQNSLNALPTFRFETIPDGLPPSDAEATQDVPSLCNSTKKTCLGPLKELVLKLNESNDVPRVTCIVSDCIMSFTLELARQLRIPNVLFWTASAAGFMGYLNYRPMIRKGIIPLKDESYLTNGYLDTVIDWIPGMEGIKLKDLPTFLRTTDLDNDIMVKFALGEVENARNASALIFNTFDELENDVLTALKPTYPPIFTIGPLQTLLEYEVSHDTSLNSIKSNLWIEEPNILNWLDSKQPNTVVYVNFGSVTVMSPQQLIEFAWGLVNTKLSFLWIIRPDLVIGESAILPPEIITETENRGLLARWCDQEKVLSHESVGGFLTHSGWNSTLDSVCGGVPMICWPFFAEQQTNCWFCCNKWGNGMEIDNEVKRDEIEKLVKELMMGDKGMDLKMKAKEWKKIAEEAGRDPYGSSYANLKNIINQVLLTPVNSDHT
jgi:hypothetical protein